MIDREQAKPTAESSVLLEQTGQSENLPYRVELWDGSAVKVERILARATSALLARAIFKEARNEYPGRRLTVSDGTKIIVDSDSV